MLPVDTKHASVVFSTNRASTREPGLVEDVKRLLSQDLDVLADRQKATARRNLGPRETDGKHKETPEHPAPATTSQSGGLPKPQTRNPETASCTAFARFRCATLSRSSICRWLAWRSPTRAQETQCRATYKIACFCSFALTPMHIEGKTPLFQWPGFGPLHTKNPKPCLLAVLRGVVPVSGRLAHGSRKALSRLRCLS